MKDKLIEIHEYSNAELLGSIEVENYDIVKKVDAGKIYIKNVENIKKATIQLDGGIIIEIWGELSNDEIIKIVDQLN